MTVPAAAGAGRPPFVAGLAAFAAEVGDSGPVTVAGGRTQWSVGGDVDPAARVVAAPAGVVEHRPADMTVRVAAGTTVAELAAALGGAGQFVPLDPDFPGSATVGGVLAVGRSGLRRLRYGPVRDTVLELTYVSAAGRLVRTGGPVVKNVSGFDLCRALVGSLGTLGLLAEAVLRTQPLPAASRWLTGPCDATEVTALWSRLHRPASLLWDGAAAWVLLEGHPADVEAQAATLAGFAPTPGPPALPIAPVAPVAPAGGRLSMPPADITRWAAHRPVGSFLAEVGVGTVHVPEAPPARPPDPSTAAIHRRLKERFDPVGRLNPGRRVA